MSKANYAVAPGEFLSEWLEQERLSQAELARRMGVSPKHVSTLINGSTLTPETALRLERVTGASAKYWLSLEAKHRADLVRVTEAEKLAQEDLSFLAEVPHRELRKRGFLTATLKNRSLLVQELMSFFRAGSVFALQERMQLPEASYRQGASLKSNHASVAAWLRLGEIDVEQQEESQPFDADRLKALVPELRKLTLAQPDHFGRELVTKLATAGVHLVYVSDLPGTATYGATWWKGGHPVIQLSLRQKDDGNFWFTLFHEIGHVLLHRNDQAVIINEAKNPDRGRLELEADEFACNVLIPKEFEHRLVRNMSLASIVSLAQELGVSPGVVVGRLQHDKKLDFQIGNRLKMRLQLSEEDDQTA